MRNLLIELLGYGLASGFALTVDMSVLEALVNLAGWHYLLASAVAFIAGGAVAYLLSVRYVFRFRRMKTSPLEFAYFVGLGAVGLIVNSAALFVAVGEAGLNLFAAKLVAAGCTFATNFTLRREVLFAVAGATD
jgi:putative flippase GtrA